MRTSWKARGMWVEEGWALHAHRAKSEHRFRLHRCRLPSRWAGPEAGSITQWTRIGGEDLRLPRERIKMAGL